MSSDILTRLNHAIDGLCPCGAPPRPNSPYCSYDCEPTHRSIHTTSDTDGTHMRWRPDLVTAHDDTDLHDLGTNTWYTGPHNAHLYQRGIPEQGQPVTWHLRLDDGHRYVGLDMPLGDSINVLADDHEQRMTDAWTRLERELGNPRHLEQPRFPAVTPELLDQRQADVDRQRREHTRQRICAWLRANNINPSAVPTDSTIRIHNGQITVDLWLEQDGELQIDGDRPVTTPHTVPLIQPWPAGLRYENLDTDDAPNRSGWHTIPFNTPILVRAEQLPDFGPTLMHIGMHIGQALRQFHTAFAPIMERMRDFVDAAYETRPEPADHPLARINARRRNQQHGPQRAQRPPRQLRP